MDGLTMLPCEFSEATLYDVKDLNSTFASGTLKVCYVGQNNNGSFISKESIQSALPSLRNVPIVSHWDYEANTIGAHDVELAKDEDGRMFVRNLTEPCGVVPEHAKFSFQVDVKNGKQYDTLIIEDVILWKRQDVYRHIINDLGGKVAHSMEINVNDGNVDDRGIFHITDFEFTALCLLESARPCFENSELEVFATNDFNLKFEEMLKEFEELKTMIAASQKEVVNTKSQFIEKGGDSVLDNLALLAKYNLTVEDLDFSIEGLSYEELENKLNELSLGEDNKCEGEDDSNEPEPDGEPDNAQGSEEDIVEPDGDAEPAGDAPVADGNDGVADAGDSGDSGSDGGNSNFALNEFILEEIRNALREITREAEWGTTVRYNFVDVDLDINKVYCFDTLDWLLYGFDMSRNGDVVTIDFESKKRMKFAIVEYVDDSEDPVGDAFAERFAQLDSVSHSVDSMVTELNSLREFKTNIENSQKEEERNEVFARFEDLNGIEAFELLKQDCSEYEADELEDKCFAIRGRNIATIKFSQNNPKQTRLAIERNANKDLENEPYGGIFVRRGIV